MEDRARQIVDSSFAVHEALGPGLLESAYQACLRHELERRGFVVAIEVPVAIDYRGMQLDCGYRVDLQDTIIVEIKAVEKRLGFLVNFNVPKIRDGIRRFAR